jgi:hypothetical protein
MEEGAGTKKQAGKVSIGMRYLPCFDGVLDKYIEEE